VVDDDARNRAVVHGMLGRLYDVVEAGNAEQALEEVRAGGVDLVLLDVMMPVVSGYELCPQLKAVRGDFLPVLMLTALSDQEDRNRGLEAGADDFLSKPVNRRELTLRVATFLRIRAQERVIGQQLAALRELGALKDDLISLIVHDLRNPLAGILGFLEVLRAEVADASRDDVEAAMKVARRLSETLNDMLQVR
jgi:DNA-binding response OmpR family regulator